MQVPAFETGNFVDLIQAGAFKKAIQTVFGVGDKPVHYARAFLVALESLSSPDRKKLLAWCELPMDSQPIGDFQWYLDQIARHEMGHAVVARVLGFGTGGFTLLLKASNGDHVATSLTKLDAPATTIGELQNYLERRVIVLMAGTMSESKLGEDLLYQFKYAWTKDAAESDRQKVEELIQVLTNLRGETGSGEAGRCFRDLALKTLKVVQHHHKLICRAALMLSRQVAHFGQQATLSSEEFDELLDSESLINPLGASSALD